jgi:hypothetical protein
MIRNKTAGKLPKGEIHGGRAQDSAKGSAPANLVFPKPTATPKKPSTSNEKK